MHTKIGCLRKESMQELYNDTQLTPIRVAKSTGFLDWDTQPSQFKRYPDFLYRYEFNEIEALKIAELSRCVTDYHMLGGKPYYRLNTPSAGNLHPVELYVQIRGIKGVISGIYYIDAKDESLVLIGEIEDDGIECAVGLKSRFSGMIFLISLVPFRSEWKYAKRSIRYCYLDAGHQLGAIMAAAHLTEQKCNILSDIDRGYLDQLFGFSNEEYSCLAVSVGVETDKHVKCLKKPLITVSPVDYTHDERSVNDYLSKAAYNDQTLYKPLSFTGTRASVYQRRSARQFIPSPLSKNDTDFFLASLTDLSGILEPYLVVLRSESLRSGIYAPGECLKEGFYHKELSSLMVDQHFLSNSAISVIFTAKIFSPEALMQAGAFVHKLHLAAEDKGLGCTGIGAFYDRKVQKFLDTDNTIIYVCSLGEVS